MTREEALERGSRLVPHVWDLMRECRDVRLALETAPTGAKATAQAGA